MRRRFETNGLKALRFQEVETQALFNTRGRGQPDVFNPHCTFCKTHTHSQPDVVLFNPHLRPLEHTPVHYTHTVKPHTALPYDPRRRGRGPLGGWSRSPAPRCSEASSEDNTPGFQVESTVMSFSSSKFETGWCFQARVKLAPPYLEGLREELLESEDLPGWYWRKAQKRQGGFKLKAPSSFFTIKL